MGKVISCLNSRELPGFKKKSFSMSVDGGEVWFEHLDGLYGYNELAKEKLESDSKIFCRASFPSLIVFNLDETEIDEEMIS